MLIFKLLWRPSVFVECPKSIASGVLVVLRPYQNMKSIWQAVFKISRSQAISCIGYNVNLQTAVAAILVFVECPKSLASEVLVVLRPYQNVKSIRQAVFKLSCSQAIFCIGYNVNLQTAVAAILVFVECPKSVASKVLVVLRPYQDVKSIRQAVFKITRSQAIVDGQGDSIIRPVFRRGYKNRSQSISIQKILIQNWFKWSIKEQINRICKPIAILMYCLVY